MKKLLLITSLTLASTGILAEGTYEPAVDHFSGAYVGGGLGFGFNMLDSYAVNDLPNSTFGFSESLSGIYNSGFAAQLFAGYGWAFDNDFYLGGEISYQYLNPKANGSLSITTPSVGSITLNTSIKQQNSLGLVAHLGYIMHDVLMPYFLVGGQYTAVKGSFSSTAGAGLNGSLSSNKWGLLIGAGMQAYICDNWMASLEYDYTYRGKVSRTLTSTTVTGLTASYGYRPNISTIMARLSYQFDV